MSTLMLKDTLPGFFTELQKIASKDYGDRVGTSATAGTAGLVGAGVATGFGNSLLAKNLQNDITNSSMTTSRATGEELRKILSPKTQLDLVPNRDLGSLMYIPKDLPHTTPGHSLGGTARSSSVMGPQFAAHELGHGRLWNKSDRLRKVLMGSRALAPLATLGTTIGAGVADTDSKFSKAMPLAGLAATAPVLADEAYASLKGYGALKRIGSKPAVLRTARRQLGKAFGTYGLGIAAPAMLAPYLTRKIKERLQKKS